MVISTVRTGKTKMVAYLDGKDIKTIQSKDEPAHEFNDAWDNLALDIKMALATQLGVEDAKLSGFTQYHKMEFAKIHYEYTDDEETPFSYDVWGHHTIVGTDYDTDVKLHFQFGEKGAPTRQPLPFERRRGSTWRSIEGRQACLKIWIRKKMEEIRMKDKIDIKDKRLLTMKEFCAYTSFGPSTAFYFATSHKMCRKIGNRWMVDRVKADRVFDHLYKVEG